MADMIKETAVVLVATIDLAVAATLVAIVLLVWSNVRRRSHG
jgi:heme exporter protein D